MVVKTFSINPETYSKFLQYCKENGISMSKQIEIFMKSRVEEREEVREEYLRKLEEIRRGKFIKVDSFSKKVKSKILNPGLKLMLRLQPTYHMILMWNS